MGLDPLPLVTAAVLQRGLASAHVFQLFPATGVCHTPADGRKQAETRCPPLQENQGPKGCWTAGDAKSRSALVLQGEGCWAAAGGASVASTGGLWSSGCSGSRGEETFARVEKASGGGVVVVGILHPWVTAGTLWMNPWLTLAVWPLGDGGGHGEQQAVSLVGGCGMPAQREREAGGKTGGREQDVAWKMGCRRRKHRARVCASMHGGAGGAVGFAVQEGFGEGLQRKMC